MPGMATLRLSTYGIGAFAEMVSRAWAGSSCCRWRSRRSAPQYESERVASNRSSNVPKGEMPFFDVLGGAGVEVEILAEPRGHS